MGFLTHLDSTEKHAFSRKFLLKKARPYFHRYDDWTPDQIRSVQDLELDEYYERTKAGWNAVMDRGMEIDCFLTESSLYDGNAEWSPSLLTEALVQLKGAFEAEHSRNLYSIGLKERVERAVRTTLEEFPETDAAIVMKPGHPTFHTQYYFDHLQWYANQHWGQQFPVTREWLTELYHLGDEKLLDLRLVDLRFGLMDGQREKGIAQCESFLKQSEAAMSAKRVIISTRGDIGAIDRLLELDNWDEFLWGYRLFPLPDFILREKLIGYLQQKGKLKAEDTALNTSYERLSQACGA